METPVLSRPPGFRELTLFFFLLKGLNNLLWVSLNSLFLTNFGASGLPGFYVSVNLLFIGSQFLVMRNPRWAGFEFLSRLSRPLILFAILMAVLADHPSAWLSFAALLFMTVYDFHATQAFADLSGHILPLREAKIHLPTVYAAVTLGSILSGLGIKILADTVGFSWSFLGVAGLLVGADALLGRLGTIIAEQRAKESPPGVSPEGTARIEEKPVPPPAGEMPPVVKKFRNLLIFLSSLAIFGRMTMDFLYNSQVAVSMPSAEAIAGFLGLFGASIDLTALALQTFVVGRVFSSWRLSTMFLLRSGLLVGCGLWGLYSPSLYSIALGWFSLMALTKAFINPAFVILLEPVPQRFRSVLRRYISIGDSVANLSVGVLLLIMKSCGGLHESWQMAMVIGVYVSMLVALPALNRLYSQTVEETLQSAEGLGEIEMIHALRFVEPAERRSRIARLLHHRDSQVRHDAILEAATLEPDDMADLLMMAMVTESEPRNLAACARVILHGMGPRGADLLVDFLKSEKDQRLIADLAEALGNTGDRQILEALAPYLAHSHHRVRGNVIQAFLKHGAGMEMIREALVSLARMISGVPLERATAAVVMAGTGLPIFVPALTTLADDGTAEVARHALHGLAKVGNAFSIQALVERQKKGPHRQLAREAWQALTATRSSERLRLLGRLTDAERARMGFWLKASSSAADEEVLMQILKLPDSWRRESLLRILGNDEEIGRKLLGQCLKTKGEEVLIDPEPFLEALKQHGLDRFPIWGELAIPLCGPGHEGYERFLESCMGQLAREALLLNRAQVLGLMDDAQRREKAEEYWETRLRVAIHLVALVGKNPGDILAALVKATARDRFLHSVALEFLEEQLGKRLAAKVFPVLDRSKPEVIARSFSLSLEHLSRSDLEMEVAKWFDQRSSL